MSRFILPAVASLVASSLVAAPVSKEPAAKALVAGLSNPSKKVRNESATALRNRADALPWLRRAARSTDKDTAKRAADLLAPSEKSRQDDVAKVIDACIRDGYIDLLTEWHQYWKPREEAELWAVGPRAAKAGMELFAKSVPLAEREEYEKWLAWAAGLGPRYHNFHNGPCPDRFVGGQGVWFIRTDRLGTGPNDLLFASVGGPAWPRGGLARGANLLALGPIRTLSRIDTAFLACDGEVWSEAPKFAGRPGGVNLGQAIIVCRGNFTGASWVRGSVLLVDGDVDLRGDTIWDSLIRASGEIKLPKGVKPLNCDIKAHAKDATAPYKFFELSDVGLSLADDEEGLVVRGVKEGTPFGNCGIEKGDLIRVIDDVPAGTSEEFRRKVRRAMVRQGDCLLTVRRGDKTLDLPVFFPLPK